MSTLPSSINLIRYLIVFRVTHSLVVMPPYLPAELSYVLGTLITERLPTRQTKHWGKMLAVWDAANQGRDRKGRQSAAQMPFTHVPDVAWPIESVLLGYPGKRSYGEGELVFWELKLFGDSAAHGLFLEMILPALEEAGIRSDPRWKRAQSLWGRFNVHAVYAARGDKWEPVVEEGILDLNYRPSPNQWAEGLTFGEDLGFSCNQLQWLTPFTPANSVKQQARQSRSHAKRTQQAAPSLPALMQELLIRLRSVQPKQYSIGTEMEKMETAIAAALEKSASIAMKTNRIVTPPKYWPGVVWGKQRFTAIPSHLLPWLELASILHIGRQTHFGCGTFTLT